MCLGVPGKIVKKWKDEKLDVSYAKVDFGGIKKDICLSLNEEANIGDYVMVHVGFAISKINEKEATKTLEFLKSMGDLNKELS